MQKDLVMVPEAEGNDGDEDEDEDGGVEAELLVIVAAHTCDQRVIIGLSALIVKVIFRWPHLSHLN